MQSHFINGGHAFYIPEIEGSQCIAKVSYHKASILKSLESALQAMTCFFNNPNKKLNNEIKESDLDYIDVRAEHRNFLKSPDDYLKKSLEIHESTAATKFKKT
jgi:hypothetical protein